MKTTLIPFDAEKAKNGAKVVTRNGLHVKIVNYPVKNEDTPILGLILIEGKEFPKLFTKNGNHYSDCTESHLDLFIEEEEVEEDDSDYNPYKAAVESIMDMVERYSELQSIEELKDFYNNVRIKCRDAFDYGKVYMTNLDEEPDNIFEINPDKWYTCIKEWQSIDMKIGDMFDEGHYYLGSDILKYKGLLEDGEDYRDYFRPWTILDAKPGDIFFHSDTASNGIFIFKEIVQDGEVVCYCDYDSEDGFCFGKYHLVCWADSKILYPATKEQRKLLFQKIKEAGYEWNSDKKELHKIEKDIKTRRMTNQELADWLCQYPEECREFKYETCSTVLKVHVYYEDKENEPAEHILIRKNHGEWQEPLIDIK